MCDILYAVLFKTTTLPNVRVT